MINEGQAVLTVILWTYNRANTFLEEMLESVLNQSLKNIKIVVFDNGSNDNTEELVKKYMDYDKRLSYYKEPVNLRLLTIEDYDSKVYTLIKENCTTPYMILTHDDDIMEIDMLEKEYSIISANNDIVLVSCNLNYIDDKSVLMKNIKMRDSSDDKIIEVFESINNYINLSGDWRYLSQPTWLVQTDLYLKMLENVSFGVGISSDIAQQLYLNELGKFYLLGEALYRRRIHEGQDEKNSLECAESRRYGTIEFAKKYCTDVQFHNLKNMGENTIKVMKLHMKMNNMISHYIDDDISLIQDEYSSKKEPTELELWTDNVLSFLYTIKYIRYKFNTLVSKDYIIWGAGSAGRKSKYIIDILIPNLDFKGYIDPYKEGTIDGYEIYHPDIFDFNNEAYIIIGTTIASASVAEYLENRNFKMLDDYVIGYGS